MALVFAYVEEMSYIDADIIHDVVKDKRVGGILPVWEEEQNKSDVVKDINLAKKRL